MQVKDKACFINPKSAEDLPGRHWHFCDNCRHAWNHGNNHKGRIHQCPGCGDVKHQIHWPQIADEIRGRAETAEIIPERSSAR